MRAAFVTRARKTLVVYLMAGPGTPELAAAAVAGGADTVEIGFPFSDPLADGPVIRRAAERALAEGMRTRACLDCLAATRRLLGPETPLIPMTYASLLEAYGWERFDRDARAAGATSLIVVDVPAGERPAMLRGRSRLWKTPTPRAQSDERSSSESRSSRSESSSRTCWSRTRRRCRCR